MPAAAELEDELERRRAETDDAGTYRLALPAGWERTPSELEPPAPAPAATPLSPKRSRKSSGESTPARSAQSSPDDREEDAGDLSPPASEARVTCPACGANFESARSETTQTVLCPECLEDVPIPAMTTPPQQESKPLKESPQPKPPEPQREEKDKIAWDAYLQDAAETAEDAPQKKKRKRRKLANVDALPVPADKPTRMGRPEKNVDDALAEIRQVEHEPPPKWLFFSDVFLSFLFRPAVLIRWIYATVGFSVMGIVWAFCFYLYQSDLFLPLPFVGLVAIFISIWGLSYAASCSLPILLETSAGNNKIDGWPEPDVREQAGDLVYLCFLLIVTEVLSALAGHAFGIFFGSAWLPSMIFGFLLYPVVLLSSLEAGTPFIPFTWPIVRSLKSHTGIWAVFYGLTACLTAVWLVPLYGEFGKHPFLSAITVAPLLAGWCFFCARLLGRLGWRIALDFEPEEDEQDPAGDQQNPARKKKKRKKKPDVSESSGELQTAR